VGWEDRTGTTVLKSTAIHITAFLVGGAMSKREVEGCDAGAREEDEMSDLAQELAENHGLFDQGEFRYEDFKAAINEALEWAATRADTLECGNPTPRCAIAERIRAGKSV
jgi:hypothetical protein